MGDGVVLPCVACRKKEEGEGPARTYPLHTLIEHVSHKHAGLSPLLRCSECSFRCVSTLSALAHATSCGGHMTLSRPIGASLFSDGSAELALKTARMEIIIKESLHKHVKGETRKARKQERERIEEERKQEKKEREKRERQKRRRSRSRSREDREKRRKADERYEEWTNEEIEILFVHMRSPPLNDSATGDRRIKDEPVDDYEYGCGAKEEALPTPTPTPTPTPPLLVDYTQMQPPKRFHINPSLLKKKKKKRKSMAAPAPAPAPSPPAHSPPAPSPPIHVNQERPSAASRPSGRQISR